MRRQLALAQEVEKRQREEALARQAERAATREQPLLVGGKRVCPDCREQLDKKRLKAKPDAVRCVECQELKEKQNRRKR